MNPQTLLESWSQLPTPTVVERLEASETSPGSLVWAARDHIGGFHLLIQVPDDTLAPQSATKGLTVGVARHLIPEMGETQCIDLVCIEDAVLNVFAAVTAEVVDDLEAVPSEHRGEVVTETLTRWRWFWDVTTDGLSQREALGLFAELWFLDQWAGVTPGSLLAWGGDNNTRHDFQWPDRSVEVKATARRGDGAVVHMIQHLDQLSDPETGSLYLFSLRVARDQLAANTLAALVSRCSEQLRGSAPVRDAFLRMVSRRGYTPVDRSLRETSYRIVAEEIYEVTGNFPRLTPESFPYGVPAGVTDVSYKVDMSVCQPWLRDRQSLGLSSTAAAD